MSKKKYNRELNPSRRQFLEMIGVFSLWVSGGYIGAKLGGWVRYSRAIGEAKLIDDELLEENEHLLRNLLFLKENYNLDIFTNIPASYEDSLVGEPATVQELDKAVELIRQAVLFYPPEFFSWAGVSGLSLVKNLNSSGESHAGLSVYNLPYFFIDVRYIHYSSFFIKSFHHEVFHTTDAHDHLVSQTIDFAHGRYRHLNSDWVDIHECDCNPYDPDFDLDVFAHSYGQTNEHEDRATMAEQLMTAENHQELIARIKNTPDEQVARILSEKMAMIKEHYYVVSRGQMDGQYWEDLLNGRIVEGYFDHGDNR